MELLFDWFEKEMLPYYDLLAIKRNLQSESQ